MTAEFLASLALAAPTVVAATPHADRSDRPGGGFLRVTFSPDGDGRNDRVAIRVTPAGSYVLHIHAVSTVGAFEVPGLTWDGVDHPAGSYVIQVCTVSGVCARTRVLAHLRVLEAYVPRATAVSPGETVPLVVTSDRAGPYTVDFAPASDRKAPGVGATTIPGPGRFALKIPDVRGGLWLVRVTSGDVQTLYPLVVHETRHATALVVHPYLTWRAYDRSDQNRDGIADTWYSHPLDPVVPLYGPFERLRREQYLASREPNPGDEQALARWLDEHGLVAQHVTDVELGRMPLSALRRYATIVFPGHTEYYEQRTYERLLAYRDGGGRLYFMSGNAFYGQVRVGRDSITRLSYRYRTPEQSDFRIAATGFRECCWPRDVVPRYRVATALPWLVAGTSVRAGAELGVASGEVDTVDPALSPSGTVTVAAATIPAFVPAGTRRYAWVGARRIPYEAAGTRTRRVAVAYARAGRGEVFSWGATGFLRSLNSPLVPADQRAALDRMALNVWRRFASGDPLYTPTPGHRFAGFAVDRDWLALAEDPAVAGACPVVRLISLRGLVPPRRLSGRVTCSFGGRFWVRPNARAIGTAIMRALWVLHDGARALAVKASPREPEVVLARTSDRVLGPVAATNWLRLFGDYAVRGGDYVGGVVSGNKRELWSATGPVLPLGLDDGEHAVSVGAHGEIAMWHAHGARYGRVDDAHARAAAVDGGVVVVLRADAPRLDVRRLDGTLVRTWPVARGAAPLLDLDGNEAVYVTAHAVHELDVATGRDRVVASSAARILDGQIEKRYIVYATSGSVAAIAR